MGTNKDAYNKIANQWQESRSRLPLNRCVVDFASRVKKNGKILDIGCGTGYPISKYLSEQGFAVTGIDVSENMLQKAVDLNLPNATFHLCDFFVFRPAEQYDGIIAFDSLFHFPKERQAMIYGILSSWMSKGAYVLFTHGKEDGEIWGDMYGERFYYSALNTRDLHELLLRNGLSIELSIENYQEQNAERDLLILAKKE